MSADATKRLACDIQLCISKLPLTKSPVSSANYDHSKVGRCKLDPGLKGARFQKFNLMNRKLLST